MKLKLRNYRYHENKTIELPDSGFILLSGKNGVGKSTLLSAISFAFFGHPKRPKPYTHGKGNCKVELEYKSLKIVRQFPSNQLSIFQNEEEYSGEEAQERIDKFLGINYEKYMTGAYVDQGTYKSVLFMRPAEQIEFIQRLTFVNDDHIKKRTEFKEYTKSCQQIKIRCEEHLSVLEGQLSSYEQKATEKQVDIGDIDVESIKSSVKNVKKDISKLEQETFRLSKELEKLKNEEKSQQKLLDRKQKLEIECNQYQDMRDELITPSEDSQLKQWESDVHALRIELKHTKEHQSYHDGLDQLVRLQKEHVSQLKTQIKELRQQLLSDSERETLEQLQNDLRKVQITDRERELKERALENIKRIIKDVKVYGIQTKKPSQLLEQLIEKKEEQTQIIEQTDVEIQELQENIEYQQSLRNPLYCPGCNVKLIVKDSQLIDIASIDKRGKRKNYSKLLEQKLEQRAIEDEKCNELERLISSLKEEIPFFRLKITDTNELKSTERTLSVDDENREQLKSLKKQIKDGVYPASIVSLETDIENRKSFPDDFEPTHSVEEIEKKIRKLDRRIESAIKHQENYNSLTEKIDSHQEQIQSISNRLGLNNHLKEKVRTSDDVSKELNKVQKKVMEMAQKLTSYQEQFNLISKYESYQESLQTARAIKKDIKRKEALLKEAVSALEGAQGLEKAGKEAEMLAVQKSLYNINAHAQKHLERMFDQPINIRLQNYKVDGKSNTKLQMNVVVQQHGRQYNDIWELSGGEKQKCNMAFLLAVNEMIGSSFLFLDDCINDIDPDAKMEILHYLKTIKSKMIILVAQEGVEGLFDHVVHLVKTE